MGFIADLFSSSPEVQKANVQATATPEQLAQAQANTQNSMNQQNAFVNALQGQNGIQNQSNVYNQQQAIANGTGPNPAQAMLNQATGQNVANQAALMAGQRGTAGNAGMIARQAAMQGANAQQQAAGQGATMQANQSLAALGQMGNIAGQQVQNLGGANNAAAQTALGQQQNLIGGANATNQANVQNTENYNKAAQGGYESNSKKGGGMLGGILNAAGSVATMMSDEKAKKNVKSGDGAVKQLLDSAEPKEYEYKDKAAHGAGKHVSPMAQDLEKSEIGKSMVMDTPQGKVVDYGKGFGALLAAQSLLNKRLEALEKSGQASPEGMIAEEADEAPKDHKGPKSKLGQHYAQGGHVVPGKAKVAGDSFKNDIVDAKLSPGEIVIPRSIANSKNAPAEAAKFVAACLARSKTRKK